MDSWARCKSCDEPTPLEQLMRHDFECARCRTEWEKEKMADEKLNDLEQQ